MSQIQEANFPETDWSTSYYKVVKGHYDEDGEWTTRQYLSAKEARAEAEAGRPIYRADSRDDRPDTLWPMGWSHYKWSPERNRWVSI